MSKIGQCALANKVNSLSFLILPAYKVNIKRNAISINIGSIEL